ncbi:MAG: amidase domain-containing protein [Firmicutes bacterium]|nr:amidase domain-containing protein [Candidatus Fermentithermobacillaceae bacterium]
MLLVALSLVLALAGSVIVSIPDPRVSRPLDDPGNSSPAEVRLAEFARALIESRHRALLTGDVTPLEVFYDVSSTGGLYAWENDRRRTAYLWKWAQERGIEIVRVSGFVEIDHISPEEPGGKRYWMEITEHVRFEYRYSRISPVAATTRTREPIGFGVREPGPATVGTTSGLLGSDTSEPGEGQCPGAEFGARAIQVLEVVGDGRSWKVTTNWYCDPLGTYWDPPTFPTQADPTFPNPGSGKGQAAPAPAEGPTKGSATRSFPLSESPSASAAAGSWSSARYDRKKAVEYAVRHSGVRSLKEGGRYNLEYNVYSFPGGDCANFASQVLAAGGLPQEGGWRYDWRRDEGSTAWVRSDSLVWHLLSSGRAECTFKGRFRDLVEKHWPEKEGALFFAFAQSLISEGDVVAYTKDGEICHVAVVVGFDPLGYPLVASHTSDRLFFPFDLGWTDATLFWFVHITY